jgi:hypothetical protein
MKLFQSFRLVARSPVFSPFGFLSRSFLLVFALTLLWAVGGRDYTCVVTGTSPTGDTDDQNALLLGVIYVLLHLVVVFAVPTLILAAAIFGLILLLAQSGPIPLPSPPDASQPALSPQASAASADQPPSSTES